MTNNDILRRLRYCFDLSDSDMIALFSSTDTNVTREQIVDWLRHEDDPEAVPCEDIDLARFLNGLVNRERGRRDPQPEPEAVLSNNAILRKLKIALALRDVDMLEILEHGDRRISKHELSAFFRKPSHRHYRDCQDQILRNFLTGLQAKLRSGRSR